MKKDDYTANDSAWKALTDAIDKAKAAIIDETSTQEALNLALEDINKAIADIEKTKKPKNTENEVSQQTDATEANNDPTEPATAKSGCGSSISLAAIVTVGAVVSPIAIKKKRKRK